MRRHRSHAADSLAKGHEGERIRRAGEDAARDRRCRPGVEGLEGRQMLSAITEFSAPNIAGTAPLTLAPDGNLWFAQNEDEPHGPSLEIGRITPSGVVTEFPVGSNPSLSDELTLTPDGNLWFSTSDSIDRITTSGAITAFPLPSGSAVPGGLTVGSDGNLWFTLSNESPTGGFSTAIDIGRITTAGAITEFPVPVAGFSIGSMTLGPDGNLWFPEDMRNGIPPFVAATNPQIGRVTPSGVVTSFPIPNGYSAPRALTVGPDGNLWFTEFQGLNGTQYDVDRITTAGDITQFPIPGVLNAGDLTVGPDGDLWFPETSNGFPPLATSGAIGRITTAGAITQFPLVTNAADTVAAGDLTVAPDGALWFIGSPLGQDGVIGRITTSGVLTEVPISPGPIYENSVLTVGSDGNLWFPEPSAGMIARINIGDVPTITAVAHSRGCITSITFDFPEALNPATARKRGFYVIDAQVKRHHQLVYAKAVRIRRITYDAAANRVMLKLARPQKGSLQVAVLGGILPDGGTSSNTVLEALVR